MFSGTTIPFSTATALFYIPTSSPQGSDFSTFSPTLDIFCFFDSSHPNGFGADSVILIVLTHVSVTLDPTGPQSSLMSEFPEFFFPVFAGDKPLQAGASEVLLFAAGGWGLRGPS